MFLRRRTRSSHSVLSLICDNRTLTRLMYRNPCARRASGWSWRRPSCLQRAARSRFCLALVGRWGSCNLFLYRLMHLPVAWCAFSLLRSLRRHISALAMSSSRFSVPLGTGSVSSHSLWSQSDSSPRSNDPQASPAWLQLAPPVVPPHAPSSRCARAPKPLRLPTPVGTPLRLCGSARLLPAGGPCLSSCL